MNSRIIYSSDDGGVCVIIPCLDCEHTIEEIAAKDVPAGKSYKIVSVEDIPSDRTFRNAWTVNEADLTDGVGAESNEFPAPPVELSLTKTASSEEDQT